MYLFYKAGVVLSYIEAFTAVSPRSHKKIHFQLLPKSNRVNWEEVRRTATARLEMSHFVDFHQLSSIALRHHAGLVE